jgi:hypothetical protein
VRTLRNAVLPAILLGLLASRTATAQIGLGATAPNFTKTALGGGSVSLNQYSGKVVVLFLLGYA